MTETNTVPGTQVPEYQHRTVLLDEAVDALDLTGARADGTYIDGTFGRGGHSRLILSRLGAQGRLIAFDKDPQAIATAEAVNDPRFTIVHDSFATMIDALAARGIGQVDGILLDLGISSPQVDDATRGFSFRQDGPLDMRMDAGLRAQGRTARKLPDRQALNPATGAAGMQFAPPGAVSSQGPIQRCAARYSGSTFTYAEPAMLYQILTHTPVYVWAILAFLIYRGVLAAREREITVTRMLVIPFLMLALSLQAIASQFGIAGMAMLAWAVAAAAVALQRMRFGRSRASAGAAPGTVRVRGSWAPLGLMLAIFAIKYVVAVALSIQPALASRVAFAAAACGLLGLCNGYFLGQLVADVMAGRRSMAAEGAAHLPA